MIFFYIAMGSAALISSIAAWFSITGLVTIFPASVLPIILMGSALELAKLVTASWLYRYWTISPKAIKWYLTLAVLVLSFITSIGIFGYLSRAHFSGTDVAGDTQAKIELLDTQIRQRESRVDGINKQLDQINAAVSSLSTNRGTVERAIRVRTAQRSERMALEKQLAQVSDTINVLREQRSALVAQTRDIQTELGPIRFIAEILFGSSTTDSVERSVRFMIVLLVVVFDPLAILLVVAANIHLSMQKQPRVATPREDSTDIATSFELVDQLPPLDNI